MMRKTQCMVLALFERLYLTFLMAEEDGNLDIAGTTFYDVGAGSFMGFHDWLRKKSTIPGIVGVRFTPKDTAFLPDATALSRTYIKRRGESMEIFFGKVEDYDPGISDDQSFQYSKVMRSSKGDLALVIDMSALAINEADLIKQFVDGSANS